MPRPEWATRAGLWLTCGGLVVLAAHQLLAVYEPRLSVDNMLLLAGAIAGYLVTAIGVFLSVGHRSAGHHVAVGDASPTSSWTHDAGAPPDQSYAGLAMSASFLSWCEGGLPDANPWNSFDQLVREMLTEQLGATRVRCYQVVPGSKQLCSLSQPDATGDDNVHGASARSGILGHVATSGQEFVAADPAPDELVQQLAQAADEKWDWVYPVRHEGQTIGLIAVGRLARPMVRDRTVRQGVALLLTVFWTHVAYLQRLRIAEKTDKASGLLTRHDFLELATRALAQSYEENEPVVVAALALEGLRQLDDSGRWPVHDALVEAIGQVISRRIRTDDIIGRFSEDRFVLLLRRLDSGLGRLIASKIQGTVKERVAQFGEAAEGVCLRAGLAGTGFDQRPLKTLLVSAFRAVELARQQDIPLHCDLAAASQEVAKP